MNKNPYQTFDAALNVRCPSYMLPALHAAARSQGMTAASFIRNVLIKAMAENSKGAT